MTEQSTEDNLILTRYLYSLAEVKHSLFLSILDKKSDEALFWLSTFHRGPRKIITVFHQEILLL
jgi:hypothetical protein